MVSCLCTFRLTLWPKIIDGFLFMYIQIDFVAQDHWWFLVYVHSDWLCGPRSLMVSCLCTFRLTLWPKIIDGFLFMYIQIDFVAQDHRWFLVYVHSDWLCGPRSLMVSCLCTFRLTLWPKIIDGFLFMYIQIDFVAQDHRWFLVYVHSDWLCGPRSLMVSCLCTFRLTLWPKIIDGFLFMYIQIDFVAQDHWWFLVYVHSDWLCGPRSLMVSCLCTFRLTLWPKIIDGFLFMYIQIDFVAQDHRWFLVYVHSDWLCGPRS